MSYKFIQYCRKCSATVALLLLLQVAFAQYNFDKADYWMKENLNVLGGRAVLIISKDGKIIYEKAENDLSRKQKMIAKFVAKKTRKRSG